MVQYVESLDQVGEVHPGEDIMVAAKVKLSNEVSKYRNEILIYVSYYLQSTTRTPYHHLPSSIVGHSAK